MENKYVIQNIKTEKWLSFDYMEGDSIMEVRTFLHAYKFENKEDVLSVMTNHKLDLKDYELFQLKVMAEPLAWG